MGFSFLTLKVSFSSISLSIYLSALFSIVRRELQLQVVVSGGGGGNASSSSGTGIWTVKSSKEAFKKLSKVPNHSSFLIGNPK